ncbi:MAG: hypothetical protein IPF99_41025 [Deltaproteobacteria bacterium]|nr:hypothetical protein [Deltaproteobacteria bacterium]
MRLRPGDSASQDLVGRIHDAVESALTRARAPGGSATTAAEGSSDTWAAGSSEPASSATPAW